MNHCDITKKKDIDMLEAIMDIQIFIRRRSQKAEKIEAKKYEQYRRYKNHRKIQRRNKYKE